jgi:carbon monoxide dehydrogenase subunit G
MDHSGTRILAAPRATVWRHLTSPESLAYCIPGCETVSGDVEAGFDMVVRRNLGLFTLHFEGTIDLVDVVPARSVTLTGRGKGGVAGHAKGKARIRLADHPGGTEIAWDLAALLEGRVARLGRQPIEAMAAAMTGRFVDRLEALLQQDPGADTA